ncbi:L,D-transpeptidase family protein [Streptomyces sp. NPDC048279]|uniref:L,D-transpeptidase family protein n=1 Tax=Streptomyces sp. NPDC048279 TaxID=3154714 RepID=UPI00341BEA3C
MTTRTSRLLIGAAAAALGGSLMTMPSAQAQPPMRPTTRQTAGTAVQAASGNYSYLEFKKGSNPQNSRLYFVYVQGSNSDHPHIHTVGSWRAGSGNGSKNTCASNAGWLPNGTYTVKAFYTHHNGGPHGVNGISWYLGDHKCHSGHWRTDLFVHSEMLPNGHAGSSEPYRWDGAGDYKSNGCIKLKPSDIRALRNVQASYPNPHKLYVR